MCMPVVDGVVRWLGVYRDADREWDLRLRGPGAYSDAPGPVLCACGVLCMMCPGVRSLVMLCAHAVVPASATTSALAMAKSLQCITTSADRGSVAPRQRARCRLCSAAARSPDEP